MGDTRDGLPGAWSWGPWRGRTRALGVGQHGRHRKRATSCQNGPEPGHARARGRSGASVSPEPIGVCFSPDPGPHVHNQDEINKAGCLTCSIRPRRARAGLPTGAVTGAASQAQSALSPPCAPGPGVGGLEPHCRPAAGRAAAAPTKLLPRARVTFTRLYPTET